MTDKIDPSTLSGTELILRQRHLPDTLASPSEAPVEAVVKQALPVDEEASEEHVNAFKAALELLAARERADKIVELAKQAQKNKGTQ
ncbi:hypothetical protein ACP3PM_22090 [Pseudomonas iridis]